MHAIQSLPIDIIGLATKIEQVSVNLRIAVPTEQVP